MTVHFYLCSCIRIIFDVIELAKKIASLYKLFLRRLSLLSLILPVLFVSSLAQAQDMKQLEKALVKHPSLQALNYQSDASLELAEAALGLPDPVLSFGINNFPFTDPSFTEFIPTNKSIGISQQIPHLSGRKARSEIAKAQSNELTLKYQQRLSFMRAQLIGLLLNRDRIEQQQSLVQQQQNKYKELITVVESEIQAGNSVVFRLAEIERKRIELSRTLVDLQNQRSQVESGLHYLLGSIPSTKAPEPIHLQSWSGNPNSFYSVAIAQAEIGVHEHRVEEAKAAWKPQWGAQLQYQQRESGDNFDGDDFLSAMVTVTIPIWSKRNQQPKLDAAKANKQSAIEGMNEIIRQAETHYTNLKSDYSATINMLQLLEKEVTATEDQIQALQINYESGEGFYSPVIDAQISHIKLKSEIIEHKTRASIYVVQMNSLLINERANNTIKGTEND